MFSARKKELEILNRQYSSDQFELTVLYGQRRVGKTALINQFIQDKKAIYFKSLESTARANLENFSQSILEYCTGIKTEGSFHSFQAALEYVFKLSQKERMILVIDEYPALAHAEKSFACALKILIDQYQDSSKLMLIVCGSSISYMKDYVLSCQSPLSEKMTAQIKLTPFEFDEACHFLKNFSNEDKVLLYGVTGGLPRYLLQINGQISAKENIKKLLLSPDSLLYEEPVNLLKQEVREPALYYAILSAIAAGNTRLSEISNREGETSSVCATYIRNLISLGLIRKVVPYGQSSRKAVYSIENHLHRFWFRFIPENSSIISRGLADRAYKRIEPFLPDYMEMVFKEICSQYLWKQLTEGRCKVKFSSLERWWGKDPRDQSQIVIDILGQQDKNTALFAKCTWKREKADLDVLEELIKGSELFSYRQKHLYLFSRSGFTEECIEQAGQMKNVVLIRYEEMI